jgi:hypothetical protein
MCDIPIPIAGEEKIVRAIKSPYHIDRRKNKLKHQAFQSKPGTDEVSVIRHHYMGSNFCKDKAKEIVAQDPSATYVGLAILSADAIRATGSTICDSRDVYCGHAHISHGIIRLPGEPPNGRQYFDLTERCKALCRVALYYEDPDPSTPSWTGPTI